MPLSFVHVNFKDDRWVEMDDECVDEDLSDGSLIAGKFGADNHSSSCDFQDTETNAR